MLGKWTRLILIRLILIIRLILLIRIRTVRRFLEKGRANPRLIILCVSDPKLFW